MTWTVHYHATGVYAGRILIVDSTAGILFAELLEPVSGDPSTDELLRRAHLMAAAPEMFAALEVLARRFRPQSDEGRELRRNAKDALDKARGRPAPF